MTLLEISDIECSKCREYKPVYDKIYKKFKSKIRFGFIHYSSYPTLSAIACNVAAKQGKFWEMLDSLMFGNKLADTLQIVRMAKNLGMDLKQFNKDLNDPGVSSRLEYNFKLLKAYGIYATPTILINGKPVFDSSSMVEIENQIKSELLTTSK